MNKDYMITFRENSLFSHLLSGEDDRKVQLIPVSTIYI